MNVPFVIDNVYGGVAEVNGMLRLQGQALVLEFQVQDSLLNVVKSNIGETVIPFDQLTEVVFSNGFLGFGASLTIRAKSLKVFENLPGSNAAELCLGLARKDRRAARDLASQVNFELSEAHVKAPDAPQP